MGRFRMSPRKPVTPVERRTGSRKGEPGVPIGTNVRRHKEEQKRKYNSPKKPVKPVERKTDGRRGRPGVPVGKGGMKKINRKPLDLPAQNQPRNMNSEAFDHLGKQGVLDLPKNSVLRKDIMNQYPDVFKGYSFRYAKNGSPIV